MNRIPSRWAAAAAVMFVVTQAQAGVPSSADSDVPCGILFVGQTNGVADPLGAFEIVIRDLAGNGEGASDIQIVLDDCVRAGDLRVASIQPTPGATVICGAGGVQIRAVANAAGTFRASLVGGGNGNTSGGSSVRPDCSFLRSGGCAVVYADGVWMGRVAIARLDADGQNGIGPADIALWLTDSFATRYLARSDFDFDGSVQAPDLSMLLQAAFGGGSRNSSTGYCQ
jgi:hypothetical protein